MGEIVAAVGTCHTPYMFTRPPDEDPNQLEQAGRAMNELGKVLDETKPDAILFFGADHVETFSVSCVPSFAIVAGDRAIAKFAGREHNLPIHRELAEDILNKLVVDHNFDMAYSEDAELGHAFSIPFEYVIGKRNIPVVPFFTNVYVPPLPTPRRCEALGKALAQIVKPTPIDRPIDTPARILERLIRIIDIRTSFRDRATAWRVGMWRASSTPPCEHGARLGRRTDADRQIFSARAYRHAPRTSDPSWDAPRRSPAPLGSGQDAPRSRPTVPCHPR